MRIVVALGGNALLRRGEVITAANQRQNIKIACEQIAKIYPSNELVIAHGNNPQVGLLALQGAAYTSVPIYPLDILGAESVGMIGYLIEQELGNLVSPDTPLATVLSQVEVDINDPTFENPIKPIGPVYSKEEAEVIAKEKNWVIAPVSSNAFRRMVPSPQPKRLFEVRPVNWLLEKGCIVICAGGGGIPTYYDNSGHLRGVEAVIDKDLCAALLAEQVDADLFVIATDVSATFVDWGLPTQKAIAKANPSVLAEMSFATGTMAPKVQAAVNFASKTGKEAVIGSLADIVNLCKGTAGTRVSANVKGIEFYDSAH